MLSMLESGLEVWVPFLESKNGILSGVSRGCRGLEGLKGVWDSKDEMLVA
jgi:hypothetical protein